MILNSNEGMESQNRKDLMTENLNQRNAKRQRLWLIEPTQNYLFYRGIKEDG